VPIFWDTHMVISWCRLVWTPCAFKVFKWGPGMGARQIIL